MKKLFIIWLLLFSLSTTVYAHSGGTDSQGGHSDGGDYHYHHGYPAHDHYDKDGDGDLDCPYDFHDNVDHEPSGNSYLVTGKNEDYESRTEGGASIIGRAPTASYDDGQPLYTVPNNHTNQPPKNEFKEPTATVAPDSEESFCDMIITNGCVAAALVTLLAVFAGFFSEKAGAVIFGIALLIILLLIPIYAFESLLG